MGAGVVGRPHGLDGSFHVVTSDPELLLDVASVVVGGRERNVVRQAGTVEKPILRLEGVDSREALEPLRGEELLVPRPALEADEIWIDELVGCEVAGVGTVRRVLAYPSCELLEVQRDGAPDLLVPLIHDAVKAIDLDARCIEVDLEFLDAH